MFGDVPSIVFDPLGLDLTGGRQAVCRKRLPKGRARRAAAAEVCRRVLRGEMLRGEMLREGGACGRPGKLCPERQGQRQAAEANIRAEKQKGESSDSPFLNSGAGNETGTRALNPCFPITFSAAVSSEGLNYSLVFRPRQQGSSNNFHQHPRTAIPSPDNGRRTHRYQRPLPATPLARPGLLTSGMASASNVETALGLMPCAPQRKAVRDEGHVASEERWGACSHRLVGWRPCGSDAQQPQTSHSP